MPPWSGAILHVPAALAKVAKRARVSVLAVLLLLAALLPGSAAAQERLDDLAEFERARSFYAALEYSQAVDAFLLLVGTEPPKLHDALLVIESRKYLAASLVFEGRESEATKQFQQLLRAEPDYGLDPLAFPSQVVKLFEKVRGELAAEMQAKAQALAEIEARKQAERDRASREAAAKLVELKVVAEEETVEVRNSRWVATVPFGAGQFQNGHRGMGLFMAISQSVLGIATIATYAAHNTLRRGAPAPADNQEAAKAERALRLTNYGTLAGFGAFVLGGVADAHIRFKDKEVQFRKRPLPPELDRWLKAELAGAGMRLRF